MKSYDFNYLSDDKKYAIVVPNIQGDWTANISYSLKSRVDNEVLKNDNISISTSYFSDIFLGKWYIYTTVPGGNHIFNIFH